MYLTIYYTDGQTIGFENYDNIKSLSFSPQVDLVGSSLPINEFTAEILVDDVSKVQVGHWAILYDDNNNHWADYWLTYAELIQDGVMKVIGKSPLYTLDGVKMPAVMYSNESAPDIILDCIEAGGQFGSGVIDIDSSLSSATVTGFCPEQTARERLTWVLFAIGAYANDSFYNKVKFAPIDSTGTLIPLNMTFWRPTVTYKDYVTAIRAKVYSFAHGTPQTTDKYVTDANGVIYIVTESDFTLSNNNIPYGVPTTEVNIDGVYLVNSSNVSAILTRLSTRYFKRVEVEADVVDNAEFVPGDKVTVYADPETMYSGFIESTTFSFGLQARAKLKMTACEVTQGANLTINYLYNNKRIGRAKYRFPVGYSFSITNPYLDKTSKGHRYIYRPTTAAATGTIAAGGNTVNVNYAIALDLYQGVLHVISVDEVTTESSGGKTIGVIS